MKKLFFGLFAILLIVAGCDDDSDCVNCPPAGSPTLDNIWPNPDSASWTYDHAMTAWDAEWTLYPTPDDVPNEPVPDWNAVFTYLETNIPPAATMTEAGSMTLTFDGMTTTEAGVTAQDLVQEIIIGAGAGRSPASRNWLLNRARLLNAGVGSADRSPMVSEGPIFLHGGAWEKSSSGIVLYGPFDQDPAWIYLTSNLRVGSNFSLQLLPGIVPNVYLYGTVYRQISAETELGVFKKALDCLYIVDYGITAVTDLQGEIKGYVRNMALGRVIYAPTVGPVYSYERLGVEPGDTLSAGLADVTEQLVETNVLD
jgi:hypothetical protein